MSLTNWLEKGSTHFCGLIAYLKNTCLEKDSIVNCDETWCRVKRKGCYKKKYIWCLVNKLSKVVIYCYEDGSRGRDALKHILGDSQVKALQSDGYNVYLYLDDHMVDIEHLCCMAHARAKFKYALDQGNDKDAAFILELIGELYKLEREYEEGQLSPEQIKLCRNNLKTKEVIIKLRSKLDVLLSDGHPPRGELMEKAINYMNTFWTQLFAYLNDGSYSSTIPLPNVLSVPWPVSERTRYSSEVTGWHTFQRYIIPSSQPVRCRVCLCLIISRDFSAKLLKDVGIMNICYP